MGSILHEHMHTPRKSQNSRIIEWLRLEETIGGHLMIIHTHQTHPCRQYSCSVIIILTVFF